MEPKKDTCRDTEKRASFLVAHVSLAYGFL